MGAPVVVSRVSVPVETPRARRMLSVSTLVSFSSELDGQCCYCQSKQIAAVVDDSAAAAADYDKQQQHQSAIVLTLTRIHHIENSF
jgi:hypothetical protein